MATDNHTTIIGNLVDDPELRFTNNGIAVANLRVAVTQRIQQDGEWRDGDTSFLKVNVWRGQAEHLADSLSKGDRAMVTGRLRQRSWETPRARSGRSPRSRPTRSAPPSSGHRQGRTRQPARQRRTRPEGGSGRPNAAATSTTVPPTDQQVIPALSASARGRRLYVDVQPRGPSRVGGLAASSVVGGVAVPDLRDVFDALAFSRPKAVKADRHPVIDWEVPEPGDIVFTVVVHRYPRHTTVVQFGLRVGSGEESQVVDLAVELEGGGVVGHGEPSVEDDIVRRRLVEGRNSLDLEHAVSLPTVVADRHLQRLALLSAVMYANSELPREVVDSAGRRRRHLDPHVKRVRTIRRGVLRRGWHPDSEFEPGAVTADAQEVKNRVAAGVRHGCLPNLCGHASRAH